MKIESSTKTRPLTLMALFTALTAICSWISIPLPFTEIPINLATFSVILAGTLMGRKYGITSMLIFLLLGAFGVPVFHNFTGGFGILAGPTGGFLIGYIFLALCTGLYKDKNLNYFIAVFLGEVILYSFGMIWFIISTNSSLSVAFISCVLPFIPGDIIKIILARTICIRIEKTHILMV